MLSTLAYCFNAVAPVFVVIGLGRLLAAFSRLGDEFFAKLNRIVYNWLIPAVLFQGVYTADLYTDFDGGLILLICVSITVMFLLSVLAGKAFFRDPAVGGSFSQGCYKSNYMLLALPILGNLLGDGHMGKAMMAAPFLAALYNLLAVVGFYLFGFEKGKRSGLGRVWQIVWGVLKNPTIVAVLLALPFALFRFRMPVVLERSVMYVSDMGTPVALVGIGAVLSLEKLRRTFRAAFWSAFFKVFVSTAVMVVLSALLGFRGDALAIITVAYAAPTAANSYATAQAMGGDGDTAANSTLLTTLFSLVAIVLFMTALIRMGLV